MDGTWTVVSMEVEQMDRRMQDGGRMKGWKSVWWMMEGWREGWMQEQVSSQEEA